MIAVVIFFRFTAQQTTHYHRIKMVTRRWNETKEQYTGKYLNVTKDPPVESRI